MKSLLPPTAAEYSFVRHIILMISRSEIIKMMCLTKHNLAQSAETPERQVLYLLWCAF